MQVTIHVFKSEKLLSVKCYTDVCTFMCARIIHRIDDSCVSIPVIQPTHTQMNENNINSAENGKYIHHTQPSKSHAGIEKKKIACITYLQKATPNTQLIIFKSITHHLRQWHNFKKIRKKRTRQKNMQSKYHKTQNANKIEKYGILKFQRHASEGFN